MKMDTLDIEFKFEQKKRKILARIEKLKEEWQAMWGRCVGNPQAEALGVQAKLEIQLMETETLDDLKELEREINIIREKANEGDELGTCN
jgi:hypothetical protein